MQKQKGAALLEYLLVVSMIAVLSISNLQDLESSISTLIDNIASEVDSVAASVTI